jgi:signal transduction histidine kinase
MANDIRESLGDRADLEVVRQRLESMGQLAAGIAHEINTPVQFVGDNASFVTEAFETLMELMRGYRELLTHVQRGKIPDHLIADLQDKMDRADLDFLVEEVPQALDDSREGIERVAKIVSAMREFSHLGAEDVGEVDINDSVRRATTVARNEYKYVAEVVSLLDPAAPLVLCRRGELNQVILNLLVNASHAVAAAVEEGGEGLGTITIRTRCVSDKVELKLADTGCGIPEEIRERVFEPFFTTKSAGKGTGQGLAIVRSLVEGMGGALQLESEVGEGTTFTIRLPMASVDVDNEESSSKSWAW